VTVIVWKLDLQLPIQSVPITTEVVSSCEVYSIQHYVTVKFVSDSRQFGGFSPGTSVSSTTTKTDSHDITEILLKVALNTITYNLYNTTVKLI